MNYKNMLLSALLLPGAIISCDENVETRIKELQEVLFQKRIELSNFGKIITDKDDLMNSCRLKISELFNQLLESKIQDLRQKNGDKEPQQEEIEMIRGSIKYSINLFVKNLLKANEEANFSQFFVRELFNKEGSGSFKSIHFLIVRLAIESDLLINFIEKYELYIQEIVKIEQELTKLQKQI